MGKSYNDIIERLEKFSAAYYKNIIFRGLISFASILIILFIVICFIEYFSFLNPIYRKILFWTYLLFISSLFIKLVFIPTLNFIKKINSNEEKKRVAKLIGQHFPEIEDKLNNILELKNMDSQSKDLIEASIERKYLSIKKFSFQNAIDWNKTIKYLKISSFPLFLLLIIFFSGNTKVISQASNRIINYNTTFTPPPPFIFEIQNEKLEVLEKTDFELLVKLSGNKKPNKLFININNNIVPMEAKGNDLYSHVFKNVTNNILFELFFDKTKSKTLELVFLPAPVLNEMKIIVKAPKHTGLKKQEYKNSGVIKAPEGSLIRWELKNDNTDSVLFNINNFNLILKPDENGYCFLEKEINESTIYSISSSNEFSSFKDTLQYNIDIIKDGFPLISIEEFSDSINLDNKLISGVIQDDYGFSKLFFTANINNPDLDTVIKEKIKINLKSKNQTFFKTLNLNDYPLKPGGKIEYFFTVYDNDKINNYKKTRSKNFVFKKPTKNEVIEKLDDENEKIEEELEAQLNAMRDLKKEIEEIEKNLIEKKDLEWEEKEKIKNLLKKYQKLEKTLNELNKNINNNQKERNQIQEISERLLQKQQKLEELFKKIMPEEMKELFKELTNSIEDFDKKELQEKIEKLKISNDDIEKEIDRNLELLKQFEFEQKLEEAIDDLKRLKEREEKLSDLSTKKENELNKLEEKQKSNLADFKKLKEKLKQLNKLKKELPKSNPLNTEKIEEEIQNSMENSLKQLEKNKRKQASKSQQLSSKKLSELEEKLNEQKQKESMEQQTENLETLRQILENLVYFSVEEENLMVTMGNLDSDDPRYIQFMYKQGDLRNDASIIEDSLFALSKRIPEISPTINREINVIQEKTNEAIDHFRERETFKGTSKQQYVMTAANNLAVLLGDILEQIQKELSSDMPSSQECQKPGKGKPKPGDLKKMQQEIKDEMEKMKNGEKTSPSQESISKELVEMLAKQEKIRMALQELGEGLDNKNEQKSLREAIEKMEKNEQDIVNRNITIETLKRQREIENKLLELDGALRDQGEKKEREGYEAEDYLNMEDEIKLKYELIKSNQKELLKTSPPSLTNYFKEKVDEYFNKLIKEDL